MQSGNCALAKRLKHEINVSKETGGSWWQMANIVVYLENNSTSILLCINIINGSNQAIKQVSFWWQSYTLSSTLLLKYRLIFTLKLMSLDLTNSNKRIRPRKQTPKLKTWMSRNLLTKNTAKKGVRNQKKFTGACGRVLLFCGQRGMEVIVIGTWYGRW